MKFLSDLECKAYEVTEEGNIKEWYLDTDTFTFRTDTSAYSGDNMNDRAVFVKVSNMRDEYGIPIEEGQKIIDVNGIEYEVKYDGCNGFIAFNGDVAKQLKNIVAPMIARRYPLEIIEEQRMIKAEISNSDNLLNGSGTIKIEINVNKLEKEAKERKVSISALRKRYLEAIDLEISVAFDLVTEGNKLLGFYINGIYKIKDVVFKNMNKDELYELYEYIREQCPHVENIIIEKGDSND